MQYTNVSSSLAASSASAFALVCSVACGAATDDTLEGEELVSAEEQELRRRWRPARQPTPIPSADGSSASSTLPGASSWSFDPVTGQITLPAPDPNVDPNSGVNWNDPGNAPVETGGQCPDNREMSGPCPNYGVQCVFEQAEVTRYCTCLASNSEAIQGWKCH